VVPPLDEVPVQQGHQVAGPVLRTTLAQHLGLAHRGSSKQCVVLQFSKFCGYRGKRSLQTWAVPSHITACNPWNYTSIGAIETVIQ
jgi:hypothetical protein